MLRTRQGPSSTQITPCNCAEMTRALLMYCARSPGTCWAKPLPRVDSRGRKQGMWRAPYANGEGGEGRRARRGAGCPGSARRRRPTHLWSVNSIAPIVATNRIKLAGKRR